MRGQQLREAGRAALVALVAGAAITGMIAVASGSSGDPAASGGGALKSVAEFRSIAATDARSRALFTEAARVITDPRCMNCHPATRSPTQGDDLHPHMPPIQASESGMGVAGLNCHSCHRFENTTLPGTRVGSVPGAEQWLLAPASMAWQGLTLGEICRQIKDPARNGGRSLADILKHMGTDHLVGWAWHPGAGREPAPGTQEAFGALIEAWIATGAHCPS
ncbi:Isoquinoline 1-oxidoreductase subunit [Ancylobacter mangrovi]|uniref:Isoquinoline 1-oxidoreductase subunit n=1 Tax=Ancylobacter mangrovi TaxID=2972472 RepID=A0A9X2T3T6_9HYPH|nr:Isoquinoline 1-oxidoreductase subunit [Ancylobacter mangrovi]MCS0497690.1 Isoquinoline 1-oxidoreductase subunit [Ancylobacter mangrovi]MCS0503260.1 Isoquinoline 1-oxidoreductase subunit [Ancylobacter mangrovi]